MLSQSWKTQWSEDVLRWQRRFGRTGLPWQQSRDPYRVWLSEIMLQQTQVATVLTYYEKFLQHFPRVEDLAIASEQEVMRLWAGLGYYSRARHLHACAQKIMNQWGGQFPQTASELKRLPGIGPSTAAAIASFCFGEKAAILDGNVKRVLARVSACNLDLSVAKNQASLWQLAEDLLPQKNLLKSMPRYTQAMMDLGATVCTPRHTQCMSCPVRQHCKAYALGKVDEFPIKAKKPKRKVIAYWLLLAQKRDGSVFLEHRPTPGIWAGLHCFPIYESQALLLQSLTPRQRKMMQMHPPIFHVLTHRDLFLHIAQVKWTLSSQPQSTAKDGQWIHDFQSLGLPAPLSKFLLNRGNR